MSRCGANGIQITASWIPCTGGVIPTHAIVAGSSIFVARARLFNDMIPGKAATGHPHAYVSYGGKEHSVKDYEVLCNTCLPALGQSWRWEYATGGSVPPGALVGGHIQNGEPLYVARSTINGEAVVGKVCASHRCAYFPYGGQEHRMDNYEVLCFYQ